MALEKTGELLGEAERARLEAEHGPCVALRLNDGSCFAFKALDRASYVMREKRVARKDHESDLADERMLQLAAVWPSREKWNLYVNAAGFEVEAYIVAYKDAFGGAKARLADADELPADADPALIWIASGAVGSSGDGAYVFAFRKPARADVKTFRRMVQAEDATALETMLRTCAKSDSFGAWLDAHLFGIGAIAEAFVPAAGMGEAQAIAK